MEEKNYVLCGKDVLGHKWYEGEYEIFDILCDSCVWHNEQLVKDKLDELKNKNDGNQYTIEEI